MFKNPNDQTTIYAHIFIGCPYTPRWCKHGVFCQDCGIDIHAIGSYFVLRSPVWREAIPEMKRSNHPYSHGGLLCLECVERRLQRHLVHDDFACLLINMQHDMDGEPMGNYKSPQLLARLDTSSHEYGVDWTPAWTRLVEIQEYENELLACI